MARLSVVHVSRSLDFGGQERVLVEFARGIDRSRFRQTFLSLTSRGPLADAIAEQGWPVIALNAGEGLRPGIILKLARCFRELDAAVVHTHDDKPLLYSAPAVKLARVPRLVHTHHHGFLPHIGPRQLSLVRLASRWTDRFVCVSGDSARYMIGQGVPPRRVLALHNGIDLDRFAFHGPDPSGPIVCVARLSPEKDIATLLRAAAAARSAVRDLRLLIAGDGPLRADLEARAASLGLTPAVSFLGAVADVPALLARARLFVLPSRTEGISLTILEAMARGLPVIATRVGGNGEVVAEDETGVIVPAGDPEALAQAMAALWRDPARCRALGTAGRRRVEACFDVREMLRRYETLYAR